MQHAAQRNSQTIEIVHCALIWLTLLASEMIAVFYLRRMAPSLTYCFAALGMAGALFLAISFLGTKPLVKDIQEICFYDVFLDCIGILILMQNYSTASFAIADQLILTLKIARVTWPLYCDKFGLPTSWPTFGLIGLFRTMGAGNTWQALSVAERQKFGKFFLLLLLIAVTMHGLYSVTHAPVKAIITVAVLLWGTSRLIEKLTDQEAQQAATQTALGIATGEAAAQAKAVAELTAKNTQIEQQAAELAIKHSQLEQLALELATQNTQLDALSTERGAMMKELANRNASLRDANHDFKVPLVGLTLLVHKLKAHVSDPAATQLLTRLDQGLEELRSMMGDIIEQAKVSTELTTPPAKRLDVMPLCEFFHDRFYYMAQKRGVAFAVRGEEFAVIANEVLLRRVITNLANNAILYAEAGTQVTLSFRRSGVRCYVRVYDTGPGITNANGPDRLANFNALIDTIKARRQPITPDIANGQGHGLGLQIVQRLCRELGSEIELQSIPGFGTVFRFAIPLAN
jgi:signal transduction histidine kinase